MRILIVDDDPLSQLFLQTVLAPFGECHIAGDGLTAVREYSKAALEGSGFRVVFMDIMMPALNGLDAIDRIREFEAHTPSRVPVPSVFVVVTAVEQSQRLINAYCGGDVFTCMKKPLERADVEAVMTRIAGESPDPL